MRPSGPLVNDTVCYAMLCLIVVGNPGNLARSGGRMHETTTEVTIRPAALSDRLAICNLLQQAWHSAGGCRWDQLDAIESGCTALLTCRGSQIAGLGLFDLRAAPVARLSAVAFADREEVGPAWADLWHAAETDLVRRGMQTVYYVGDSPWLLDVLMASGFRQTNTLVSYERSQDGPTAAGHAGVRLRSGRPGDLDAIAEIDRASAWTVFRRITLPLCAPLLMLAVLLRATDALKQFDLVMSMTGPNDAGTQTLSALLYQVTFQSGKVGLGSAYACIVLVVVIALATVFTRYLDALAARQGRQA